MEIFLMKILLSSKKILSKNVKCDLCGVSKKVSKEEHKEESKEKSKEKSKEESKEEPKENSKKKSEESWYNCQRCQNKFSTRQ